MTESGTEFAESLLKTIRSGRSFGGHPLWFKISDHIVVRHATTAEAQAAVRHAVQTSLAMWWQFFDGMDRAYGAEVRT